MQQLEDIIARVLKTGGEVLPDSAGLGEIPAWDSLSHMELIAALESTWGFELTGDEIAEMVTLEKVREIVSAKVRGSV